MKYVLFVCNQVRPIRDQIESHVREPTGERRDAIRIRGHVLAIAHRRTSECLREEVCEELVGAA